jgi:hypothetical protein
MSDAYRSGFNKGSADKLSGRHEDDAVPPQHRTNDAARRAYKKGYQEGYRRTLTVRTSGYLDGAAKATAKASIDASVGGGPVALLAAGLAAIAIAKGSPGGLADDSLKEIGKYLYDKLIEMGATAEQLQQVSDIAKLGIKVAAEAKVSTSPEASPVAEAPAEEAPVVVVEKYAGFSRTQAAPKTEIMSVYKRLPGESVAEFRARRAKEIAAEEEARKSGPRSDSTAQTVTSQMAPSWISSNWPWLAAGTVVVAAGGGYFYYRSKH